MIDKYEARETGARLTKCITDKAECHVTNHPHYALEDVISVTPCASHNALRLLLKNPTVILSACDVVDKLLSVCNRNASELATRGRKPVIGSSQPTCVSRRQ